MADYSTMSMYIDRYTLVYKYIHTQRTTALDLRALRPGASADFLFCIGVLTFRAARVSFDKHDIVDVAIMF